MARFIKYSLIWVGAVALFNLICILSPSIKVSNMVNGESGFWVVYGFVMAAFLLHLIFSYVALDERHKEKRILNIPLFYIITIELFILVGTGITFMSNPTLPNWVKIISCYVLLFIYLIFFFTAKAVGDNNLMANAELNRKTYSFRALTDAAQELITMADTNEKKQIAQSVYEKIRYSDMVSNPRLEKIESDIFMKMNELTMEYQNKIDIQTIKQTAQELILMVDRRNNECKALKRHV